MQVDNLILEKCLGKGSFGEVYLTKKVGDNNKIYATKKYDRDKIEGTEAMKYLKNEISILQTLHHPNIVKFEDVKKTKKHFYIVMDFCNGGELSKALEKYQLKYGKPFSQEIVQYLMRQIIDAFKYIHGQKIMHRDIKLENILLAFQNEKDKKDLNMMKAQIKIIDFGFACRINKDSLTYTAIGNPINMDPLILKKLNTPGKKARQLGYDQKADIWSLGAICYEMLIGKAAFDAEDMEDLVNKVEAGKYNVPTSLSKEVISFLNGMLQYEPSQRLTIEQLYQHPFLTNNIRNFHSIDVKQVSNKLDKDKKELIIDVKKNKSIWAIFNQEDENKLNNIPGQLGPIPEIEKNERKRSQEKHIVNKFEDDGYPIRNVNTYQNKQKMGLNNNIGIPGFNNNAQNYNNYNRPFYGPYLAMQGIPGNQMYQMPMPQMQMQQIGSGANQTLSLAPTTESYTYSGGNIYGIK